LRAEYLCDFAALYHFLPREVDALRYLDFIQLVVGIEAERKARKERESAIQV
jgi:hypothetical protein